MQRPSDAGKVLGGTSTINGMMYMRGNPWDYDRWQREGLADWGWDSVLPYFKKSEDNRELGEDHVEVRRGGAGGGAGGLDVIGRYIGTGSPA